MKKILLLALILLASVFVDAQDLREIVYLKNGNLIRGIITEMVPNDYLIIKSRDGKLYTYSMSEVSRIENNSELKQSATPISSASDTSENAIVYSKSLNADYESGYDYYSPVKRYVLKKGYRGFFEIGYSFNTREVIDASSSTLDRIEMSMSHGYQINPYFFIGLGVGLNYFYDHSSPSFPLFINPRVDFNTGKVSPFIDLKGGYTFGADVEGLYVLPSAGVRLALDNGNGINFGLGYTFQQVEGVVYSGYYVSRMKINLGALTFKVGVEF